MEYADSMALLAQDLFDKRQRLLQISQVGNRPIDAGAAQALEAERRLAQDEYLQAKAVFARAMKADKQADKRAA